MKKKNLQGFWFRSMIKIEAMKKNKLLILLLLMVFSCILTSYSPYVPSYGGKIQIKNTSAQNLYIVFQSVSNTERMLCIEKAEQLTIPYSFQGDYQKHLANPANYYTEISFYDLDSGVLLKKLTVSSELFVLKSGSINSNNAVFEFSINDTIPESGL